MPSGRLFPFLFRDPLYLGVWVRRLEQRQSRKWVFLTGQTEVSLLLAFTSYLPRFGCSSWDPPTKASCWVGFMALWCNAESELVLETIVYKCMSMVRSCMLNKVFEFSTHKRGLPPPAGVWGRWQIHWAIRTAVDVSLCVKENVSPRHPTILACIYTSQHDSY